MTESSNRPLRRGGAHGLSCRRNSSPSSGFSGGRSCRSEACVSPSGESRPPRRSRQGGVSVEAFAPRRFCRLPRARRPLRPSVGRPAKVMQTGDCGSRPEYRVASTPCGKLGASRAMVGTRACGRGAAFVDLRRRKLRASGEALHRHCLVAGLGEARRFEERSRPREAVCPRRSRVGSASRTGAGRSGSDNLPLPAKECSAASARRGFRRRQRRSRPTLGVQSFLRGEAPSFVAGSVPGTVWANCGFGAANSQVFRARIGTKASSLSSLRAEVTNGEGGSADPENRERRGRFRSPPTACR